MNSLAERLKEARQDAQLSQSELARRAGVSQSTINNIESRRNNGSKYLFAIADALGLNPGWLADGVGPKHPSDTALEETEEEYDLARTLRRPVVSTNAEYFPVYEFSMSDAGEARWKAKTKGFYVSADAAVLLPTKRLSKLRCLAVHDAAMAPMLLAGDLVLVDTDSTVVRDNTVYALYFEGEVIYRQVVKQIGGHLALRALDAQRYPDKLVPPDMISHIAILGRVIYRSGPLSEIAG
jgi:phage repressor protein C with HTH and peptisase S24 domain